MKNIREKRKHEHIEFALKTGEGPLSPGWEDIHLVHQALLDNNLEAVDTSLILLQKKLSLPIIINAMTGGAAGLEEINLTLAEVARDYGLAIAVGSQTAGINNQALAQSYQVVRKVHPEGVILANVSAGVKPEIAQAAVEMIGADALQLHLNGAQELLMAEGDRQFKGWAENIEQICRVVHVPVFAKEVGCGISREVAERLAQLGVSGIDTGGSGGTNFAAIELARSPQENFDFLRFWGIPSALSLIEVCSLGLPLVTIASGGITNSWQIIKALALGADAVGIAGSFLRVLIKEGETALRRTLDNLSRELKVMMMLTGATQISEIKKLSVVVTGFTREWCQQRGIKGFISDTYC